MKLIKTLLLFVVISAITFSCKDTKKEQVDGEMDAVEVAEVEGDDGSTEVVEVAEVEGDDGSTEVVEVVEVEGEDGSAEVMEAEVESVEGESKGLEEVEIEGIIVEVEADTPVIYPGCEGASVEEIRACSKKAFIKFLGNNFNKNLAQDLGIRSGDHKIRALVKIDESGKASVLQVDAPSKGLEKEVTRIIDKLPQMTAATEEGQAVSVSFILPINFTVD